MRHALVLRFQNLTLNPTTIGFFVPLHAVLAFALWQSGEFFRMIGGALQVGAILLLGGVFCFELVFKVVGKLCARTTSWYYTYVRPLQRFLIARADTERAEYREAYASINMLSVIVATCGLW